MFIFLYTIDYEGILTKHHDRLCSFISLAFTSVYGVYSRLSSIGQSSYDVAFMHDALFEKV